MESQMGTLEERREKIKKDLEKHDMEMLVVDGEVKELQVKLDESVSKKNKDIEITRQECCYS